VPKLIKQQQPDAPAPTVDPADAVIEALRRVRVPQLRLLQALAPEVDEDVPLLLSRAQLCARAGFSEISGTITSALNGVKDGSSTVQGGAGRPGLLELGLVARTVLDVDGAEELTFRATPLGVAVLAAYFAGGGKLPKHRDAASSTNQRYRDNAKE
jgi:hypothetical protein